MTSVLTPVDPDDPRRARRAARRRRTRRRRLTALAVLVAGAGGLAGGIELAGGGAEAPSDPVPAAAPLPARHVPAAPRLRPLPDEIRGVHVTMSLANVRGKLAEYVALRRDGLNTIELDVKDESGHVAFVHGAPALARAVGAARAYYDPRAVARQVHAAGLYLIGRVVSFEDPIAAERRPDLAVHRSDGSVWHTSGGLAWLNPYNRIAWRYDVDVAAAAARAGFDEIQFDYVRFPSDGDLSLVRYPGAHPQSMARTVPAYLRYAVGRLRPLGVRVSADVFGLAASQELGIGQHPRRLARVVDAIYPMVYPSHYTAGELGLADPNASPGPTVGRSLRDFRRALSGGRALLVPWLQDFSLGRTYGPEDVAAQVRAARAGGSGGYMLWNAEGLYTAQELAPGPRPIPRVPRPSL